MRLQVFLSRSRVCSRRKALRLVEEGQVRVGGQIITEPSYDVDPASADVYLGSKRIELKENVYLVLNKPRGFVTTLKDRHAERIVTELLPAAFRCLYPVGRLDKDSEGLLLFTNDGDLTYRLLHPKFKVDKVYLVEARGRIKPVDVLRLRKGIFIEGKKTRPALVNIINASGSKTFLKISIHEGRKRQIRLMLAAVGYTVLQLKRVQYGPISLGGLKPGKWRLLNKEEISQLMVIN